jgi:RNA polymerase sigma-70 factor (ECF subfamily)
MSETHDSLIPRIRERDADALAQYIEGNRWRIMAFIERQLGGALRRKVEPDDIFQEASADAVRALPEMDLAERDPFGWICQIAERRIVDAHRRFFGAQKRDAGREVPLGQQRGGTSNVGLIDMLVASMTTPSQVFSRNAREARLMDAIAQLPEEQREALRMRYVESLPSKLIAEKLGKSDAAVRVMLTRSLKKLQTILTEEPEG